MLTGKIRNDIDKLWEKFWTGSITTPFASVSGDGIDGVFKPDDVDSLVTVLRPFLSA